MEKHYSPDRVVKLLTPDGRPVFSEADLLAAESEERIPSRKGRKSWRGREIPALGRVFGFMPRPPRPLVTSVFVTKGGVLKSSLTLNLARIGALNGLKVCVVGLDMQGDITTALGFDPQESDETKLEDEWKRLESIRGLPDLFFQNLQVESLLVDTDLPNLKLIPETPELVAMEQNLNLRKRREYWLRDHVIEPLKQKFDWILLDCSPNWNQLITNALVASDVLISPVECKINNYRNLKMFLAFIEEFQRDLQVKFRHIFVPTRLAPQRKLSREINSWYHQNLRGCTQNVVRESTQGEEAVAMHLSLLEYALGTDPAEEMKQLCHEIWREHSLCTPLRKMDVAPMTPEVQL